MGTDLHGRLTSDFFGDFHSGSTVGTTATGNGIWRFNTARGNSDAENRERSNFSSWRHRIR